MQQSLSAMDECEVKQEAVHVPHFGSNDAAVVRGASVELWTALIVGGAHADMTLGDSGGSRMAIGLGAKFGRVHVTVAVRQDHCDICNDDALRVTAAVVSRLIGCTPGPREHERICPDWRIVEVASWPLLSMESFTAIHRTTDSHLKNAIYPTAYFIEGISV
jgi:hypothetical protein